MGLAMEYKSGCKSALRAGRYDCDTAVTHTLAAIDIDLEHA